ncbi:flavodoxin [Xenorhabdus szentirmaii]|uniref:Flavodoxin-like domain-containing protein n=1 Tax=Xenorhabdus szentirmaii DSM 16338 TaxID=1427518 RepID=W1IWK8_9GAMM|nr:MULTISPECIES: flavodoxin [Xenorhabdus]MBD2781546.1 flavodoxin [Xenorhabdus sp. 38]MBD2793589.1 flavodoxin [Xenorhabdus sp. CUL]MBD2803659.1 flavodoxin [Xenorhabdus sp. ZM]MBD2820433.1 flavodoxin [Xenorhabdus sp. 42]MBD2824728.1 flavodoxin [Xenorhabdus sp. 5]
MAKIGIFVGTVYGNALAVAEEALQILTQQGHQVEIFEDATLEQWQEYLQDVILVVTSTTGNGDLPDGIEPLYTDLNDKLGYQPDLRYGMIVLGDSSYDTFCGGGRAFDELLQEQGAKRIGDMLLIDAIDVTEPEIFAQDWIEGWGTLL